MRRGFTIVELVITITIMGILLTLAVVNLTTTEVNGRDAERKGDIEAIALALESYYNNEDSASSGVYDLSGGSYPATINISNTTAFTTALPDIDPKSVRAPGVDASSPISLVAATNATATTSGVLPQPTISTYVYQPLQKNNTLCTQIAAKGDCRKFNLYYRLEADNQVYMVTSKRQS